MGLFANKRFTVFVVSLLVLLNTILIGIIVFHEVNHNGSRDGERRPNYFAERLDFTDEQRQQYDSLNSIHKEERNELQQQINSTRREFFKLSHNPNFSAEQADSLTSEIGALVSKMERNSFDYIANIRALCTAEQLERLDDFIQERMKSRGSSNDDDRQFNGPKR